MCPYCGGVRKERFHGMGSLGQNFELAFIVEGVRGKKPCDV